MPRIATVFNLAEWVYDQCPGLLFNEAFQLAERLAQQYPEILYRRER